jgi:recombination protein RecA
MYGEGVSKMGELIDLGVKAGVVEKSGSWFSHQDQRIGQGRENAKTFLREHPEIAQTIEQAIRQDAGLVAEAMMGGPGDADAIADDDDTVAEAAAD